jgi:protein-export membrane protein SecD
MLHFPRWKVLAILAVVLAGVVFALPNVLPKPWQDTLSAYTGLRPMTKGLDLQGGTSLLMELDGQELRETLIAQQVGDVRALLRHEAVGYTGLKRTADGVRVTISDADAAGKADGLLSRLTQPVTSVTGADVATFELSRTSQQFSFRLSEPAMAIRTSEATDRALEVLNRRLDALGISELSIQRQGLNRILIQLPGQGISDQAKRILGLTGIFAFQMICDSQPTDSGSRPPEDCAAYPMKDDAGQSIWVQTAGWAGIDGKHVSNADARTDSRTNEPIVTFRFNQQGAQLFGELTARNVGKPMAIVFDGQVVSAPRINEPILGGTGQISGNFTPEDANNLAIALRSGALPARLVYIDAANESAGSVLAKGSDL